MSHLLHNAFGNDSGCVFHVRMYVRFGVLFLPPVVSYTVTMEQYKTKKLSAKVNSGGNSKFRMS